MDPDVTVSAGLDSVPFHVVHIPESGTQRIDVELEYGSIDVTVSVDGGGATIHRYDVSAHCRAEAVVWRVESSNGRSELRWQRPPPLGDTHTIVGLFTDGTESVLYPEPWGEVSWLRTLEPFAVLALFVVCCVLLDLSPRRTCAGRW